MFGSTTLEVAVALAFIYLLLSLTCSTITELIASVSGMRAKNLAKGVEKLVSDGPTRGLFLNHPLIKALTPMKRDGTAGKPSYIPARIFSMALLDVIVREGGTTNPGEFGDAQSAVAKLPESDMKRALLSLMDTANKDLEKVRRNVEEWFDDTMDRVSGWYKRKAQGIALAVAAVLTIGLNVDTIAIVERLSVDPKVRAAVVAAAAKTPEKSSTTREPSLTKIESLQNQLEQLKLPFGWSTHKPLEEQLPGANKYVAWLMKIFGWLLTTVAVSLGAPFWFDVLNKVVNLRGVGRRPEGRKGDDKKE